MSFEKGLPNMDSTAEIAAPNSEYEDEDAALRKFAEETDPRPFDEQMQQAVDNANQTATKPEEPKRGRGRPVKKKGKALKRPVSRFPSEEREPSMIDDGPVLQSAFPVRNESAKPPPLLPALSDMSPPRAEETSPLQITSPLAATDPLVDIPPDDGYEYGIGQTAASGLSSTHGEVLGAEVNDIKRQVLSVQMWQKTMEGRMKAIETSIRSLEASATQQSTAVLDRFRQIERTFSHDPVATMPATELAGGSAGIGNVSQTISDTSSTPPSVPQKRKITFEAALRSAKETKKRGL